MVNKNSIKSALYILIAWTIAGLLYSLQSYYYRIQIGLTVDVGELILYDASFFLLWALFTPLIIWVSKPFPLEKQRWARNLLILLIFAVGIALLHRLVYDLLFMPMRATEARPFTLERLYLSVIAQFDYGLLVCLVVMGTIQGWGYFQRYVNARENNLRLEAALVESRLDGLQKQLQPHFLFNTLNAIRTLVQSEPSKASDMIERLADLLRASLKSEGKQFHSLDDELKLLHQYLSIEQSRFGERLKVTVEAPTNTQSSSLPTMILQPLAENAIRHGIGPHRRSGEIRIVASLEEANLIIIITDNGDGFNGSYTDGVGLSNVRKRLDACYGDEASINIGNADKNGALVKLIIPQQVRP